MNELGLSCRRCGQVTKDVTTIYGRDWAGALVPKQAQCSPRCAAQAPVRPGNSPRAVTMTASRPGLCRACGFDIIPGDVLARAGEKTVHYECAPAESPRPEPRRRERTRVTTVRTRGAVV